MSIKNYFTEKRLRKKMCKEQEHNFLTNHGKISNKHSSKIEDKICVLWTKCLECKELLYKSTLAKDLNVCKSCSFHHRLNANERINLLIDSDTFKEINENLLPDDPLNFQDLKTYKVRIGEAKKISGVNEAVITGVGNINNQKVAIACMEFNYIGGSMGSVVGEKITRLIEYATKNKLPLIIVCTSGGARMQEGIFSLMQMAKTSSALKKFHESNLLYISVLTDPTFAGVAASFAALGDIIIAEPKAKIGFAGRKVIEETIKENLPEEFQTAEYLLQNGQIDLIVDRPELKNSLSQIIKLHSSQLSLKQVEATSTIISVEKNDEETTQDYSPLEIIKIARHPQRPHTLDYIEKFSSTWIELRGDRAGKDDASIVGGLIELDRRTVMLVGTQKGRNIKENQKRNFGMPSPEGYRKALRLFKHAEKFNIPIVTLIDTPGAYPGLEAENHNQIQAIALNLRELAGLTVPVIAVITGEGGSGGALALGVANRVLMLENSFYSVISPEGCAVILWKTKDKIEDAAKALKITSKDLYDLKICDEVIPEVPGGAHCDHNRVALNLKEGIIKHLNELSKLTPEELKQDRQEKIRNIGVFLSDKV